MRPPTLPTLREILEQQLGKDHVTIHPHPWDVELCLTVHNTAIVRTLIILRDHPRLLFKQLTDICGVDYPHRPQRFEVVYHLLSLEHNHRLRVKVVVGEQIPVPSVGGVYNAAPWYEREIWDLYGIPFSQHPDLRRLLTDYNFDGHPLRKDFPLSGFEEVRYDAELERVVYEPVVLPQEYRHFDFLSPWEGPQNERKPPQESQESPETES